MNLTHLITVQESKLDLMTTEISTGGKNELEQKRSEKTQTIDDFKLLIALGKVLKHALNIQ